MEIFRKAKMNMVHDVLSDLQKLKVTVSMDAKPQSKGTALDIKEWEQTFQELICQEKPRARWTLKMDGNLRPNCVAQGWRQYQQRGFGRFQCSSCRRSWASAQVQILFHMYLENQKSTGKVLMRIFGQRCKKCFQSQFEKPDFSPESSQRILKNLAQRVLEKFYRNGIRKASEIPVKPEVPLDGSHDKANCEACILGYCGLSLENCMTGPGKSSLSFMNTGSSSPHNGHNWKAWFYYQGFDQDLRMCIESDITRQLKRTKVDIMKPIKPLGNIGLPLLTTFPATESGRDDDSKSLETLCNDEGKNVNLLNNLALVYYAFPSHLL
ncbi:hypothetical protein MG293_000569 [Ovis ammon polii]|uniref:3CxxC-type domain-containing protein n=1 Tax=Ovis ammon polii TaxID=230172 RepID=A0AAD4UQ94_OVIAM|nr:hypothetical protein MG293_000569 [Ovis ammon polii]